MSKRKATEQEKLYGIGLEEVDENGIEPEEADEEQFTGFAQEVENEKDDDELVAEYEKHTQDLPEDVKGEK